MGVQPPFMYDKPSSYAFGGPTQRGFDPKAATRASWTPPAPKPKTNGPLIDFNKHPDSYLIVPYGNLNVEPMNPKTKVHVKRSRKVQLALRLLSLLGAVGLLFCVIAINKTSTAVGWIIRVGPAVALCHCIYSIYHLCRDAASRSAASSASYMLFAAMVDTGLIPFFAFSAIMANSDYQTNYYGWSTLFGDDVITYKIIYAFFLTSVVEGSFMLCSLILDIYLAIVFRKIAKMPPDMNPLEDNLTARPNGKHKRNKSEMVFEKHLSGSTLATQRMSQMKNPSESNFKRVPFVHTRTDSADSITLYGNEKALNSRVSLRNEMKEASTDPYRNSTASSTDTFSPSRPTSAITPAVNARTPGAGLGHKPTRSSGLAQNDNLNASWLSYQNKQGVPSPLSDIASRQLNNEVRPLSPVSMMSDHELPLERVQSERQNWYSGSPRNSQQTYQPYKPIAHDDISTHDFEYEHNQNQLVPPQFPQQRKRSRDPLGMNPPTPVQDRFRDENDYETSPQRFSTPPQQRPALHDTPTNSSSRPGMGSRPSSFVGSGGKSRYYGNLRTSLGGSPTRESFETGSPTRRAAVPQTYHSGEDEEDLNTYSRTRTMQSDTSGNFQVYNSNSDSDSDSDLSDHQRQLHNTHQQIHDNEYLRHQNVDQIMLGVPQHADQEQWNGTRKVSNSTGYDLKTGYAGLSPEFGLGMARRREVSGKVVEEGRGGAGYGNIGFDEVSNGAVLTGQGVRGGAAGWKRFHGL